MADPEEQLAFQQRLEQAPEGMDEEEEIYDIADPEGC